MAFSSIRNLVAAALAAASAWGCGSPQGESAPESHAMPDTLRVATLYSPASYFIYREEKMGYDYSLVAALAEQKGMHLDLVVASSLPQAIAMVDSGIVDLLAYEVAMTLDMKERLVPCGPVSETSQVLVQPRKGGDMYVSDVTQLVGRDVYVEDESKYLQRIRNLNDELGGGINIHAVARDTIITEDLIDMVSKGEIPLTIVDSDIAGINKTYYPDLDISLQVSFPQRSSWAVSKANAWLADSINAWLESPAPRQENAKLLKRYFELSKMPHPDYKVDLSKGRISPYDEIFRRHAPQIDWDWRLLAAQCFVESRFKPDAVSWAGARGLMQIMPATARRFGAEPDALVDPELSVRTAVKVLDNLERTFEKRVPDHQERLKFVIAAYHSGAGHIVDAIALARLTQKDPQRWDGNVEEALKLKSNPLYYNLPEVKNGYYRSRETTEYVDKVFQFYDRVSQKIPA